MREGGRTKSPFGLPQWITKRRALCRSMSSRSWAATMVSMGWVSHVVGSWMLADRLVLNSRQPCATASSIPIEALQFAQFKDISFFWADSSGVGCCTYGKSRNQRPDTWQCAAEMTIVFRIQTLSNLRIVMPYPTACMYLA